MLKNKFFTDGNSSSSEESSDDEQQTQVQTGKPDVFYVSYNASIDNGDDTRRVIRSEKEKRYEEIEEVIEKIKEAIHIRDINRVYEHFENLIKTYNKARRVIEKEQKIPQFYIQILVQLDDFVNQCWNDKDQYNKLNKINLNKLRRYLKQQSFQNNNDSPLCKAKNQEDLQDTIVLKEEEILKKLDEIISMRGKRGINYQNQIECLNLLRQQENLDFEIVIKILSLQITVYFDYHHEHFKLEIWTHALDHIEELLTLLSKNIDISCNLYDDLIALILQMNEEFTKIFQNIDPHSQEYIDRLKDEFRICSILDRFKIYSESNLTISLQHLCTIYLCIIEHIYYKISDQSSIELMNHLCKYIYTNDTSNRLRIRANLCQIYHFSLHNYYNKARDLMLMCHIQDTIHLSDISTQILYNRTMVQIGLCAFRFGEIQEAHQALVDIQSGNRIKELLGQDILPYHMYINLELIECIYLISAMLIETSTRRKHFNIIMYQAEKQLILGPPESMCEHIIAANNALKIADWKLCVNYLFNDKMNNKIWKLIPQVSQVIEMLINKIKEKSLRIYLFNYASVFSTISIPILVKMFELPIKQVYGIIYKMIINKQLTASIEQSNEIILMQDTNSSRIQTLSVELTEKISRLYEQNEKLSRFYIK